MTGNEPIYPIIVRDNYKDINGDKMLADVTYTGKTLYQEALLKFMCSLTQAGWNVYEPEELAARADVFAQAYITQLNKQQP